MSYLQDKSTKSNREANAEIFRQVAEAYEILSDTNLRQEYDTYRYNVKETRRPSSSPSQQSPSTYQTPDARNNPFDYNLGDMFRNLFSYDYDYSFEPILARQYFPSGEVRNFLKFEFDALMLFVTPLDNISIFMPNYIRRLYSFCSTGWFVFVTCVQRES